MTEPFVSLISGERPHIDLHVHSTASDGTLQPSGVVSAAAEAGLDIMALTDHDTLAGWDEAFGACPTGMTVVPGLELSCVYTAPGQHPTSVHLLGYLVDPEHPGLAAELRRLQSERSRRGEKMVDNLVAAGYPITWARVREFADGGSVGRPHVGRALVEAGVVASVDEAFVELLSAAGPFYVRKADLDAVSGVRLITAAGGVAVLAHPAAGRRGRVVDEAAIAVLAAAGLAGIEVDHPDHLPVEGARLRVLAAALGLVPTGSSDFHGSNKVNRLGEHLTHPEAYQELIARAWGSRPYVG
ncbi:MAG: PHP domain-containing protein [Actinomycetota bacterium]|nr:PHP domain-containing protein [Actinomycetota bacterium]